MIASHQLEDLFREFLSGQPQADRLERLRDALTPGDIPALLNFVAGLADPSEYSASEYDADTPARYFLFLDFVTALLINLGDEGRAGVEPHLNTQAPFLKWVVKFVADTRFHAEIMAKFQEVFD